MKIFIYILIALGLASAVYNAIQLDFSNLLEGNSFIATVSLLGSLCAVILLVILRVSMMISEKDKMNRNRS